MSCPSWYCICKKKKLENSSICFPIFSLENNDRNYEMDVFYKVPPKKAEKFSFLKMSAHNYGEKLDIPFLSNFPHPNPVKRAREHK